jgi:hypothetical protein
VLHWTRNPKGFDVKRLALYLLILLFPLLCQAKTKVIPPAPLPDQVTHAKTVFLVNAGGSDLAFDEFYQDMKAWGKYQIVGNQDQADLILELRYWTEHDGQSAVPVYNSYTKQTTYYSRDNVDPQLQVAIYDAKTKATLWSGIDHRKLARLSHNRDKEIAKSADRLVDDMKARSQ